MTSSKIIKIAIGFGIIFFAVYILYMALPYLITLAGNILYLSGALIFLNYWGLRFCAVNKMDV